MENDVPQAQGKLALWRFVEAEKGIESSHALVAGSLLCASYKLHVASIGIFE